MLKALMFFREAYFDTVLSVALQYKQMDMYSYDMKEKFFKGTEDVIQVIMTLVMTLFILSLITFHLYF
jgi:hypothetical protein